MGLGQWIIIIVLAAIIIFGFAAVFDFGKGVIRNVYPATSPFVVDDPYPAQIYSTYIISKVVRIIDGDTILLENGDRIRLAIVNTPERGEPGYDDAVSFTTSLCLDKIAFVDIDNAQPPSYNRLVGAVYCSVDNPYDPLPNHYFLNKALLVAGHAVVMESYCEKSEFAEELCVQ